MAIEEEIQTSLLLPTHKRALINILFTNNWISEEMNKVLKPFDISLQQFNVLRILKGQKGKPANLNTIQERMIAKNSNTTRLVDKLLIKGLVSKQICKSNKRKIEIFITETGVEFLIHLNKAVETREKEITNSLSYSELETISELLTQLRTKNK